MTTSNNVFLDTSALVDLCFWDPEAAAQVRAATSTSASIRASRYVIFELARGFLRNLILIHNKTYDLNRYSDLIGFIGRLKMQGHYQGTLIGALQVYRRTVKVAQGVTDKQELLLFRADLKIRIRRGWKRSNQYAEPPSNPVRCRPTLNAPKEELEGKYRHDLPTKLCGEVKNCGLKKYAVDHSADFKNVANCINGAGADDESKRRAESLLRLIALPEASFNPADCIYSGDAIIVHEARGTAGIVTKNVKHQAPIGIALGVNVSGC